MAPKRSFERHPSFEAEALDGDGQARMLRAMPRSRSAAVASFGWACCALAAGINACSSFAPGDIVPPGDAEGSGGSASADVSMGGASGQRGDGSAGLDRSDHSLPDEGCIRGTNGCDDAGKGDTYASADSSDAKEGGAPKACPDAGIDVPPGEICQTCNRPPSCQDLDPICGSCGNDDCCTSLVVPAGEFNRFHDPSYHASVSRFALDKYEVTVGRFRRFAAFYFSLPLQSGAGRHPRIPQDTGWQDEWVGRLPTAGRLGYCNDSEFDHTWTSSPADNETLPMNCINWYVAFAFCAWDGGRLPTQMEWAHAAMGGAEERVYPWSSSSTFIDDRHANYDCSQRSACDVFPQLAYAGDKPLGAGRWGHFELAGNAAEWNLDFFPAQPGDCVNCARLTPQPGSEGVRAISGGHYQSSSADVRADGRMTGGSGEMPFLTVGFRCARDVAP